MKTKLINKFEELLSKRNHYGDMVNATRPSDTYEWHELDGNNRASIAMLTNFYNLFVSAIPADKLEQAHARLVQLYEPLVGKAKIDELQASANKHPYYTSQDKKCFLFKSCPDDAMRRGPVRQVVEEFAGEIDDQTLERIIADSDEYKPEIFYNYKVYPWRSRIEKLKEKNRERVTDSERLLELNNELDSIAELVVTSTVAYSDFNGDTFDAIARKIVYMKIDETNERQLQQDEYKHLTKYFKEAPVGGYDGVREIKTEYARDTGIVDLFMNEKLRMIVPKEKQDALLKIVQYMTERNMLSTDAHAGETGGKIYGFKQIYDTQNELSRAIETDNLEAIREAKASYNAALENMRGLYALIRQELNPNAEMMLGNVTSYRSSWMPNEFKNDIYCNVFVNAIFNFNINLVKNGITYEQFFENSGKSVVRMLKNATEKFAPNNALDHSNLANAIKKMAEGFPEPFSTYGFGRNFELVYALTHGTPEYERNALSAMLTSSYSGHVGTCYQDGISCSVSNYLKNNAEETLANIFLVNPEDRNYGKLRADETLSIDLSEKTPPFNSLEYLSKNLVPPAQLTDRIKTTIADLLKTEVGPISTRTTMEMRLMAIRGAQIAAHEYLMVHSAPSAGFMTKGEYKELKMIAENPEKAFGKLLSKDLINELRKVQPIKEYQASIVRAGEAVRAEARDAETAYQNRVEDIKNELASLSQKIVFAENDVDKERELGNRYAELEATLRELPKQELDRLDKAYAEGKLPRSYYDQRRLDVQRGTYTNKAPFGTDGCPTFDEFKKGYSTELESKQLSKADVQLFYDRMIENARFEENQLFLFAAGKGPGATRPETEKAVPQKEPLSVPAANVDDASPVLKEKVIPASPHKENVKNT